MQRHIQMSVRALAFGAFLTTSAAIAGCGAGGGGEEESAQTPTAPAVDPSVATADALVETFNRASQPPYDLTAIAGLFVAETPEQEPLVRLVQDTMPLSEFALLVEEKFPGAESEILNSGGTSDALTGVLGRATITQRNTQRATARVTAADGSESDMQLVQMRPDGPWAISGYTIEHELESSEDAAEVRELINTPFFQNMVTMAGQVLPDITRRLRADEFETIEDVEAAYMQGLMTYMQSNPDAMQGLSEAMQQNPDFGN